MAETAATLNGRRYRLSCGDGEEERLQALSRVVGEKLDALLREYGR